MALQNPRIQKALLERRCSLQQFTVTMIVVFLLIIDEHTGTDTVGYCMAALGVALVPAAVHAAQVAYYDRTPPNIATPMGLISGALSMFYGAYVLLIPY